MLLIYYLWLLNTVQQLGWKAKLGNYNLNDRVNCSVKSLMLPELVIG